MMVHHQWSEVTTAFFHEFKQLIHTLSVLMKCVCHSLALCVQHAFEVMPSDVGYILSVVSSWFSNSDIRRMEYQSLFEAFEIDDDANEDSTFLDLSVIVWLCLLSNFQKQGGWLEEGSLQ